MKGNGKMKAVAAAMWLGLLAGRVLAAPRDGNPAEKQMGQGVRAERSAVPVDIRDRWQLMVDDELMELDATGAGIPGFGAKDCDEIFGDDLNRVATWRGRAEIGHLAGVPVRLRFIIKDADVYAFGSSS